LISLTLTLKDDSKTIFRLYPIYCILNTLVVHWTDVGLSSEDLAIVRDLWTRKNIGSFRHNYASSSIEPHRVMMLNISLL